MPGMRSAGDGTVFKDPNGGWIGFLELPRRADGRRHRVKRRGKTRAEVVRKLRRVRDEYNELGDVGPSNRRVAESVADYQLQIREPKNRSSSDVARDRLFARTIVDQLGDRRIGDLTVQDCDDFLARFVAGEMARDHRPVSRDYVNRVRAFLIGALKNDVRQGYLSRNVADVSVVPATSARPKLKRALTIGQWRQLSEASRDAIRVGVELSGRHGLRPQEARAVLWSDIDWGDKTLSVVTQRDSDNKRVDTKTVGSTRTIRLHPEAVDSLRVWRDLQIEQSERYQWSWSTGVALLTTRHGSVIRQENYLDSLVVACRQASVEPITPYELRHTAITHQIEAGMTASQVADWAGTSVAMIYKHYRHKLREVVELDPLDYEGE